MSALTNARIIVGKTHETSAMPVEISAAGNFGLD